jgi:hypothetical protein
MRKILLAVLAGIFLTAIANAQTTSTLNGKITNSRNEVVPNASVRIEGLNRTIAANVEGRFTIVLETGKKYTLTITSVGYKTKVVDEVEVRPGNDVQNEIEIVMEADEKNTLQQVVVRTTVRKENTTALINFQRNSASVSSGIAADFIRRTPDKNTGEVLKRVSGASIQDNKFVVVRGLSDRYNAAMLNNAQLPSSEPDKKAFSFDVFPAALIDNIVINKTATPDLPGEFAGGLVQVNTKDIPSKDVLTVGVSLGYNTQATFKKFTSNERNGLDWLGFDDGARDIPNGFPERAQDYRALSLKPGGLQEQLELSRLFSGSAYKPVSGNAAPIQTYSLTFGKSWKTKSDATWGAIFAVNYRNAMMQYDVRRGLYENNGDPIFQLTDAQNRYQTNTGAIANFTFVKGKHKISFKNLFNQLFDDNYYTRTGFNTSRLNDLSFYSSYLNQRSLYSGQLEGEHQLTKSGIKLRWNGNAGYNWKKQPDLRTALYARSINTSEPFEIDPDDTRRFYSDLKDYSFGGGGQLSIPMNWGGDEKQNLKLGGSTLIRIRDFKSRIFRYIPASSQFNTANGRKPVETVFLPDNITEQGFVLEEFTNNSDKYFGVSALNAGYAMLDNKFNDFRIIWGVRVENFQQLLTARDHTGDRKSKLTEKWDVLPSLNVVYSFNSKNNLRISGSRTVARPEFREIAEFAFYDYEQNYGVKGDTGLRRSAILNFDLRYEFYPKAGEAITLAAFYKSFDEPIEFRLDPSSNADSRRYFYQNALSATTLGFEAEIRKSLAFIGKSLEDLSLFANFTYLFSEVTFNDLGSGGGKQVKADRPLQGQSPYLINAGLQFTSKSTVWGGSLLYNRIGQRLSLVGNDDFPSVYERPRNQLDFQVSKKILNKRGELRLTVADIFNNDYYFYENVNSQKAFNEGTDRLFNAYKPGTTFTVGFTYDFNIGKKK